MRGVAFDCYGTLLQITRPLGASARAAEMLRGRDGPSPMTTDIPIDRAVLACGARPAEARDLLRDMEAEAASVEPIPGALEAIASLRDAGVRLAFASNLSREYADPVRRLLPDMPAVLSFAVGARKPKAAFFHLVRHALGVPAGSITMIGDSRTSDHGGATAAGMRAILLRSEPLEGIETAPDALAAAAMVLDAG